MKQNFFIGVDGGATKCIVRVEDETHQLLGREQGGPANIRLSVDQAWQSIYQALDKILKSHGLSLDDKKFVFHAGMGLAGCESKHSYQAFIERPHPFASLVVTSDAHTACLGAHQGQDGAIIIAGTGVIGWQIQQGESSRVGGYGFPHDDQGGGAWLGWQAARLAIKSLDGRAKQSALSQAVIGHFKDASSFIDWLNAANSTALAELAPLVITQSQQGDQLALSLLKQAASHLNKIWLGLRAKQLEAASPLPCALLGGVAEFIKPHLSESLRMNLVDAALLPDCGAINLVSIR